MLYLPDYSVKVKYETPQLYYGEMIFQDFEYDHDIHIPYEVLVNITDIVDIDIR